jgi:hypothetical protein
MSITKKGKKGRGTERAEGEQKGRGKMNTKDWEKVRRGNLL